MNSDRNISEHDIIIKFANEVAAKHFASWLCEQGEQDYWNWMECRESEEQGDISIVRFDYHREDENKDRKDPNRYGKFMSDNVIRTKLGRLTK